MNAWNPPPGPWKAIAACLSRPFAWGGRAGPAEFWWFTSVYLALQVLALAYLLLPPVRVAWWWREAYVDGEARAWEVLARFDPPPFPDLLMPVHVMSTEWFLYLVLSIPPTLSWIGVLLRRLHDTGHRGWWAWVAVIPGVGVPLLIVLLIAPGEIHRNRFGPGRGVPRRGTAEAAAILHTPVEPLAEVHGSDALRALRESRMRA
jgi:uncharacterized membrane protein YhaH (DUF805 family)